MNKTYKYGIAGATTVAGLLVIIISCPPIPFPQPESDDDVTTGHPAAGTSNGSSGHSTGGTSGRGGSSGHAGSSGSSGNGGHSGSGSSGSSGAGGGLPQHPCVTVDHPNISSSAQLLSLVESASHCLNEDVEWDAYCEVDVILNGCSTCLVAFPNKDLTQQALTEFVQILGSGNVDHVRCSSESNCVQPENRRWAVVVDTDNCSGN